MRPYTMLWFVWALWVLWIVKALYPDEIIITGITFLCSGGVLALFLRWLSRRGYESMNLLKRKNNTERKSGSDVMKNDIQHSSSENNEYAASSPVDSPERMKPIITRKDTFISSEAILKGDLNGDGNIVIEGALEGNVSSTHQVRIEQTGQVSGDIHAQHIMVNGRVVGRLFAEAITLQPEGRVEGDLVTDALIIEKGGVFVGQSQLKTDVQLAEDKGIVTPLKALTESATLSTKTK